MPRWGKVGKQKIVDEGPLAPFPNMTGMQMWQKGRTAKYDMETFDSVLVDASSAFMDKAKKDGKPFFLWHNTTRMHVFTYLPPNYQARMNATDNYNLEEAGMAQMDDAIGKTAGAFLDIGEANNTIVIFTDRQRCRSLHLARRRHDPSSERPRNGLRGWLPCTGDHPALARHGEARCGRERDYLGFGLVPDAIGRCG